MKNYGERIIIFFNVLWWLMILLCLVGCGVGGGLVYFHYFRPDSPFESFYPLAFPLIGASLLVFLLSYLFHLLVVGFGAAVDSLEKVSDLMVSQNEQQQAAMEKISTVLPEISEKLTLCQQEITACRENEQLMGEFQRELSQCKELLSTLEHSMR